MYYWESWQEDDDGNTEENRAEGAEQPLSVTEASDDELLSFAGYVVDGPGLTVHRDFDGRAYIKFDGATVAVVESALLCGDCGRFEHDWAEGKDGYSETCPECLAIRAEDEVA